MRAARAFLGWSARDLSKHSGVSHSAIARAEKFDGTPPMQPRNMQTIKSALECEGIEFFNDNGLRMRK